MPRRSSGMIRNRPGPRGVSIDHQASLPGRMARMLWTAQRGQFSAFARKSNSFLAGQFTRTVLVTGAVMVFSSGPDVTHRRRAARILWTSPESDRDSRLSKILLHDPPCLRIGQKTPQHGHIVLCRKESVAP